MRVNDLVFGHRLEQLRQLSFLLQFCSAAAESPAQVSGIHSLFADIDDDCLARLDVFLTVSSESLVWVSESWATSSRPAVRA